MRIHVDVSRLTHDPGYSCFSRHDTHLDERYQRKPCRWDDVISDYQRELLTTHVLPQAVSFMSDLLSVERVDGPLRLRSMSCGYQGGVPVPEWMRREGLHDADFVIFVTMRPIGSIDTVAYAGHCETDQRGRPIAAHFNWAPTQFPPATSPSMLDYLSRIAEHELTHSLVFTAELISYFPPPRQGHDDSSPASATQLWSRAASSRSIAYLPSHKGMRAHVATPRVVAAVQRHFGCPSLRGAQLEDGGGAGTALAHWEMTAFRDEYMVGSSSPSKRYFSAVTAALYEDSGWYDVNEALVEPLAWGYHAGCGFVQRPCSAWQAGSYRCSNSYGPTCSYDRRSRAYCSNYYLSQGRQAGASTATADAPLGDWCPAVSAYRDGECTDSTGYSRGGLGEERCDECRCFETSQQAGCFRMRCINASALQLHLHGRWLPCDPRGGMLPTPNGQDGVLCPPAAELCGREASIWPQLHSVEPAMGPEGTPLTLRGEHLDALTPPITLSFTTATGDAEAVAFDLVIVSATLATATMPALVGATSRAPVDVSLIDASLRTANMYEAFLYDPGWQQTALTIVLCIAAVLLVCGASAFVRAARCGPAWREIAKREAAEWRNLAPQAEARLRHAAFSRSGATLC